MPRSSADATGTATTKKDSHISYPHIPKAVESDDHSAMDAIL